MIMINLRKICTIFLLVVFLSMHFPAFAEIVNSFDDNGKKMSTQNVEQANNQITISFVHEFNANKSDIGDVVDFRLNKSVIDSAGDVLPENTIFKGRVDKLEQSKLGFRRAKVHIAFDRIVLPDGREFSIVASTEKPELKSSAGANVAKGIASTTVTAGVCMVSAIVIAIECFSVVGLIFAPYVGVAAGVAISTTTKGVNYKVPAGTQITIKFDRPLNIPSGF